ncbi:hypothetical protein AVDCRST_MAG94-1187 [uncultured Leptolyngbya sp.]|uniref:Uncharacterized protein n=1 Tax=uncultured Leptolyngbya sp. TaxID=332963 RepID=A0A6J4KUD6_9CYAN|nr:hypothetical protein AVDCRST_MAG94-1187 [uncultured Leptolyngbya sp.]
MSAPRALLHTLDLLMYEAAADGKQCFQVWFGDQERQTVQQRQALMR